MFTGIIHHSGKVATISNGVFRIEHEIGEVPKVGSSIAHDGACMTVTDAADSWYEFQAVEESLSKTNFGEKKIGDEFNIETSLRMGDPVDGHFVSGHIDCIGKIKNISKNDDASWKVEITYPQEFENLIVAKGWITINGVSLTVVDDNDGSFSIALIPITQEKTNLGKLEIGDTVNLEFDQMAKYAQKLNS